MLGWSEPERLNLQYRCNGCPSVCEQFLVECLIQVVCLGIDQDVHKRAALCCLHRAQIDDNVAAIALQFVEDGC
jgi:hypothetical protein